MANNNLTPIIYDQSTKEHKPANLGEHLNPAFIPVDDAANNLLQNSPSEGLGLKATSLISTAANNALVQGADGRLYVDAKAGSGGEISPQATNYIYRAPDGGLIVDANSVLANGSFGNLLHSDPLDRKVTLTVDDLIAAGFVPGGGGTGGGPSTDPGNIISAGTDGKPFMNNTTLVNNIDQAIASGQIRIVSQMPDNIITNMQGAYLGKTTLAQSVKQLIQSGDIRIVSADAGNRARSGSDGGCYIGDTELVTALTNILQQGLFDVVSNKTDNVIQRDPATNKVYLSETALTTLLNDLIDQGKLVIVSKDSNNALGAGSDGGAYLAASTLEPVIKDVIKKAIEDGEITVVSSDANNLVTSGTDGGSYIDAEGLISTDADNGLKKGADGKLFCDASVSSLDMGQLP